MKAKIAFQSSRTANTHVWSKQMDLWHELCNEPNDSLFRATYDGTVSEKWMAKLRSVLGEPQKDNDAKKVMLLPLPDYYSSARKICNEKV